MGVSLELNEELDGGQAILTLRGWAQSGRFTTTWSLLSATYRRKAIGP